MVAIFQPIFITCTTKVSGEVLPRVEKEMIVKLREFQPDNTFIGKFPSA
jgi:hypothetical protein